MTVQASKATEPRRSGAPCAADPEEQKLTHTRPPQSPRPTAVYKVEVFLTMFK